MGKRHEALQPLSRDHHQALKAAIALKRADVDLDPSSRFLEFWDSEGQRHFRVEEEVLLPLWAEHGPHDHPAVIRVLTDHVEIRRRAMRIRSGRASVEEMRELGQLLDDHVRFEERQLFPLIEDTVDEGALATITAAVLAAEESS